MHRFLAGANALTIAALLFAAACALLAISDQPAYATIALMAAGVCDLFDGYVARRLQRTPEQRLFGSRLDSLVDACAFGFAPVVLLYTSGLDRLAELPLLGLLLTCAVWRLAYFDTLGLEAEGDGKYYVGLPTTYVALVLPLVFLTALAGPTWFHNTARVAAALLAGAMISPLRVRKPGGIAYAFFLLLAVTVASVLVWFAQTLHDNLQT